MASLSEIVDRARQIAEGRGVDPFKNPVIDAGMTTEALVPHCFRHVLAQASIDDLRETCEDHDIEIDEDSVGTLPSRVLRKYENDWFLPDIPRSAKLDWPAYNRSRFDNLLCYFTHRNGIFKTSCELDYGELVRSIASVSKIADTDEIQANATAGSRAQGTLTVLESGTHAQGWLFFADPQHRATGTLTIVQGVAATGTLTFAANATNGETIVINGVTVTFRSASPSEVANEVLIGASKYETALNLVEFLNASNVTQFSCATYTILGQPVGGVGTDSGSSLGSDYIPPTIVGITYDTYGTVGNAYTLVDSSGGHITRGAATLLGGIDGIVEGETLDINGARCQFSNAGVDVQRILLPFSNDATVTATQMAAVLNASINPLISAATYTASGRTVQISYDTLGTIGNLFMLSDSLYSAVTRSGAFLTGGVGGVVEGETIDVNGVTFTFSNFNIGATYIPFSAVSSNNAQQAANVLNASSDGSINVATYTATPGAVVVPGTYLNIVYDSAGAGGNSFTLANSLYGGVSRSNATLTGGGGTGIAEDETIDINGVTFTFKASPVGTHQIKFTGDAAGDAFYIADRLNKNTDDELVVASYASIDNVVYITYRTNGEDGNLFTLANSSANAVLRSASTLLGGTGDAGGGDFVDLSDTGRRIVVTVNGSEVINAIAEEVFDPDSVKVRDYRAGATTTEVTDGTAAVYETVLETIRVVDSVTMAPVRFSPVEGGSHYQTVARVLSVAPGDLEATAADIGRLITIDDSGDIVVRAIITDVIDEDTIEIAGYAAVTVTSGEATIYRIMAPTVTLNAPSIPEMPSSADDDIDATPKIIENTILTLAGALTGEISIETLLSVAQSEQK